MIISTCANLLATIKAAAAGAVIGLLPGQCGGPAITGINIASPGVTIENGTATGHAQLTNFNISKSSGLHFIGLDLLAAESPAGSFQVNGSHDVSFDHVVVHGPGTDVPSITNSPDRGMNITGSQNVSVTNSEFHHLVNGVNIGTSSGVAITGNSLHDIRSDGVDFQEDTFLTITRNHFGAFYPINGVDPITGKFFGDHPDRIQGFTAGTHSQSHDILISHNIAERTATGGQAQCIFLSDQVGLLFDKVTIDNNLCIGPGANGITLIGAVTASIHDNELVPEPASGVTWFRWSTITNFTQANNVVLKPVTDNGAAALAAWTKAH